MNTKKLEYIIDGKPFEGFVAYENAQQKKPLVLIAHAWAGRSDLECDKAQALAKLGYVGFALDVYGKGLLGNSKEENTLLMQPLMADRQLLQKRLLAGLAAAKQLDMVDQNRIAAIGFCFGGLAALDLARAGADIKGVVSFHGLLGAPANVNEKPITAKILVLHGHDDPMVPPEQVLAFSHEMTKRKVDWQIHVFGNTMHAFTNPHANDADFGTVYNKLADQRAWQLMQTFFTEVL